MNPHTESKQSEPAGSSIYHSVQADPLTYMECICDRVNGDNDWWAPTREYAMPPLINYHLPMFSSAVGAQIAWWLAFFPPERFLILTSAELRTQEGSIAVRACPSCRSLSATARGLVASTVWLTSSSSMSRPSHMARALCAINRGSNVWLIDDEKTAAIEAAVFLSMRRRSPGCENRTPGGVNID